MNGEGTNNPFGGGDGGRGGGGRQFGGSGGGFNLNWDGAWKVRTDVSTFRPSNADRSFIVKISRMFDALR